MYGARLIQYVNHLCMENILSDISFLTSNIASYAIQSFWRCLFHSIQNNYVDVQPIYDMKNVVDYFCLYSFTWNTILWL